MSSERERENQENVKRERIKVTEICEPSTLLAIHQKTKWKRRVREKKKLVDSKQRRNSSINN